MVKLCLMASHGYPHVPELGFGRFSKQDCQNLWPTQGPKHDLPRLDSFNLRPHHNEEPWKPISGFPETIKFVNIESTIRKPVLIDVQDTNPNSTLFSFGIAENYTRQGKILKFLMSPLNDVEKGEVDMSTLAELLGLPALINYSSLDCGSSTIKGTKVQPSIIYPSIEFKDQGPITDVVGDLVRRSKITFNEDGRVSFTGTGTELKDILSVVAEYYLVNNSTKSRKQTVLIPHFNSEATTIIQEPVMLLDYVKYSPVKSPEKVKLEPSSKKKTNKKPLSRDLYERNYFHACETLLSIIVDKKKNKKTAMLSLKKSGPELPHLLTQLSSSIAGTGLAVLFSVLSKLAYSKVPFCSSKVLNTGIGFGLVWLSSAVNSLRDTVVHINKKSGKMKFKEEDVMGKLDRCVKDLFFRGAALMVVMVLRLA